jgi:putative phosphoesterase
MRIGILSDTHDRLKRTLRAVDILRAAGVQALIHCGDITSPEIVLACAGLPGYFVFGNNDYDLPGLKSAMATIEGVCLDWGGEFVLAGKRLAVTHGHTYKDVRRLMDASPDYLFTGHTHHPDDDRVGATRRINPGALHRADRYTVAVLDLTTDELTRLTIPG